jgi:hypothetical protein
MTIPIDRDELRVGALRDGVMSDTISREAAVAVLVNEIDGDDYENDAPLTRCIDRIRALPAAPAPQPWTEGELAEAIARRQVILRNVDGGTNIGTMTPADAAMLARVALSRPLAGQVVVDYAAAAVVVYGGDGHYSHDALIKARAIVDAAIGKGKP